MTNNDVVEFALDCASSARGTVARRPNRSAAVGTARPDPVRRVQHAPPPSLVVVALWFEDLKAKLPASSRRPR